MRSGDLINDEIAEKAEQVLAQLAEVLAAAANSRADFSTAPTSPAPTRVRVRRRVKPVRPKSEARRLRKPGRRKTDRLVQRRLGVAQAALA